MFRAFNVASTGLDSMQKGLESIINNVSNQQTTAYKANRLEYANIFPQVLQKAMTAIEEQEGTSQKGTIELGSGVKIVGNSINFTQGNISVTNNELDIAIQGDGFLKYIMPDYTVAYGRAGNLKKNSEGYLVSASGHLLEPQILIPETAQELVINPNGQVFVLLSGQTNYQEIGQIELAKFINPSSLAIIGDNLYKETMASGEPIYGLPTETGFGSLAQYSLETSNVDVIKEMMNMVLLQRAFDIVSKAVQGGEAMLKSAIEIASA